MAKGLVKNGVAEDATSKVTFLYFFPILLSFTVEKSRVLKRKLSNELKEYGFRFFCIIR